MGTLLAILTRSAIRLVVTLGVVILILLAVLWLRSEWADWDRSTDNLVRMETTLDEIKVQRTLWERSLKERAPSTGAPIRAVAEQRNRFEIEIRDLDEQIRRIERENKFTSGIPGSPAFLELAPVRVKRVLWQQARDYTDQLHKSLLSTQDCGVQLLTAEARMLEVQASIYSKLKELDVVNASNRIALWNPMSGATANKETIVEDLERLTGEQAESIREHHKRKACTTAKPGERFTFVAEPIDKALQPLVREIDELKRKVDANAIRKFLRPVVDVLPTALWIVFGLLVSPIVIKLFAFFIVAPMASRCRALQLLPGTTGQVEARTSSDEAGDGRSRSAISQSLVLRPDEYLLVHGDYMQSSAVAARKDTHWLLDWSMPLTSLAAGLYGLMRFSGENSEVVVLSSSSDPFQELAVVVLPAGSALVLQPRCLVGFVRRRSEKLRITRHWRLGYLSSWLTLQFRYIVFHGPVTLVLQGCRGVRVEPAGQGRLINQAATLGFSANVAYSTGRCETFGSYLLGQQELFNDRFSGASGVYIYEETPRREVKGGITGRGIDGVLDSLLKVVGI